MLYLGSAADVLIYVLKNHWGYRRVRSAFGSQLALLPDGSIDRDALADVIFRDAAARKRLNRATHIPIFCAILSKIVQSWLLCRTRVIIDMPLLFETGFYRWTKPNNVLVTCSPEVQLKRLTARDNLQLEAAKARVAAQTALHRKEQMADIVIRNDGSIDDLNAAVLGVLQFTKKNEWLHKYFLSPPAFIVILAGLYILVTHR